MKESDKENIRQEIKCDVNDQRNNACYPKEKIEDINAEPANVELKISDVENKYHLASCLCDFQTLNSILAKNPTLVDVRSPFIGYAALHFACKFGKTDVIRSLVGNYKANVNLITSNGKTPLHIAVEFKQEDAIRILLSQYNANKNIRDYSGRLPADIVEKSENFESIMKLVGPPTAPSSIVRQPKNLKKSTQNLSISLTPDSAPKSFFSFRKSGETGSHSQSHLAPSNHVKDSSHSMPTSDSIKKSLSFLNSKLSVKHP